MSPEELAEARHYAACYQDGYVHDLMYNLLDHIDQQAIQIKALERDSIRLASKIRELEADVLQKSLLCDSLAENCNSLKSDLADSEKRNADLRRAIDEFANSIFSQEQAARIKELEAALKSEKAWVRQYQKWLVEEVAEGMSENGFADDDLRQKARDSLILDGKIGPDADAKPREGLYGKYRISKADGSPVDPNADYFVLRLDTDPVARRAAREYSYMTVDRKLALELQKRITRYNPKMMDCINLQFFGVEKPRVWQITDERVRAIQWAEEMAGDCKAGDVLRVMLEKAGQEIKNIKTAEI